MAERDPSKFKTRVRFPLAAPKHPPKIAGNKAMGTPGCSTINNWGLAQLDRYHRMAPILG
jgi:hypothetical protein